LRTSSFARADGEVAADVLHHRFAGKPDKFSTKATKGQRLPRNEVVHGSDRDSELMGNLLLVPKCRQL